VLEQISDKKREALKSKLRVAFEETIGMLSAEMQDILLDDIITAFENRYTILLQAQRKIHASINIDAISIETLKLELAVDNLKY
jgi:hypothetical protein